MQRTASTIVVAMIALTMQASAFVLRYAAPTKASVSADEEAVVLTAVDMLQGDVQRVLGINLEITDHDASIIIGTMGGSNAKRIARSGINLDYLVGRKQAFVMAVDADGHLVIAGSDAAGTAYGIIELTRQLGVSPWEWWADV